MGFFDRSSSSSTTNNVSNTQQLGNYGDGIVFGGDVESVNYNSSDFASQMLGSVETFAETAIGFSAGAMQSNSDLVGTVLNQQSQVLNKTISSMSNLTNSFASMASGGKAIKGGNGKVLMIAAVAGLVLVFVAVKK